VSDVTSPAPDTRAGGLSPAAGRTINPALFAVVVGSFFFAFFTVECSAAIPEALKGLAEGLGEGQQLNFSQEDLSQSVTGWQLVTGDTGEAVPQGQQAPVADPGPDYVALAAFVVAALGVALSWLRRPIGPALAVVLGTAGTVLLIVLWIRTSGRIPDQARAFVDLHAEPAFWVATIVGGLAALWGATRLILERERAPAAWTTPQARTGPAAAPPPSTPPAKGPPASPPREEPPPAG
jgi:hypothetical protein